MSNVVRFPAPPPIRAIESVSPVRAQAEALMRTIRTHPDVEKVPVPLFFNLVNALDVVVLRIERAEAERG